MVCPPVVEVLQVGFHAGRRLEAHVAAAPLTAFSTGRSLVRGRLEGLVLAELAPLPRPWAQQLYSKGQEQDVRWPVLVIADDSACLGPPGKPGILYIQDLPTSARAPFSRL